MKLRRIIKSVNAKVTGFKQNLDIDSISTDSRTIKKGELFIALNGRHFSGRDFIVEAIRKGACAIIADRQTRPAEYGSIPFLIVEKTEDALSLIAKLHRDASRIPFICIVGSNGKTTTKELLSHIFKIKFKVLKTDENYNNQIGVAKTLLKLKDHDIAVIEAGTNSPGEIAYSGKIIRPEIVITTNIGLSHLMGLKTVRGVFREKIAMVESLTKGGTWIRNCDDRALLKYSRKDIKIIDFAVKNKKAGYRAENIVCRNKGIAFIVKGKNVFLPLLGVHNIYNCLAAIAAASIFLESDLIIEALASFKAAPMRMQAFGCDNLTIINDAYNANPDSLKSAVSVLKNLQGPGRNMLVCADMLELGNKGIKLHYDCGRFIAKSKAVDILVAFGQYAPDLLRGALDSGMKKNNVKEFKSKKEIIDFIKLAAGKNDTVLVKGSRSMKMDEVVEKLIAFYSV